MTMITINSLPDDVSDYIQSELSGGKYHSAEELVSVALRELRDREKQLEELRTKIDEGVRDLNEGRFIEIRNEEEHREFFDSIKRIGRERLSERRRNEGT